MTYSSVHNYFEHNELLPSVDNWEADFAEAVDQMIWISQQPIEHFDIHDLINILEVHFGIYGSDLLEEYDKFQIRSQYRR